MTLLGRVLDVLVTSEAGEHALNPVVMPPIAFAGIAAAIFLVLAIVTFSYRDVANRHSDKIGASPHQDSQH
jgi:hypothetical protein